MTQLQNDAYGHTVTFSTDGTTDTYVVGGSQSYQFPAGTSQSAVYLSIAQQWNLQLMNSQLTDYVNDHYSPATAQRWLYLWEEMNEFNQPNKANYIKQGLAWSWSISQYVGGYIGTIMGMTDPNQIAATTPNFGQFDATDPKLSLIVMLQIVG